MAEQPAVEVDRRGVLAFPVEPQRFVAVARELDVVVEADWIGDAQQRLGCESSDAEPDRSGDRRGEQAEETAVHRGVSGYRAVPLVHRPVIAGSADFFKNSSANDVLIESPQLPSVCCWPSNCIAPSKYQSRPPSHATWLSSHARSSP